MSAPDDKTVIELINQVRAGSLTEEEDDQIVGQLESWYPGISEIAFMSIKTLSAEECLARARYERRVIVVGEHGATVVHPDRDD